MSDALRPTGWRILVKPIEINEQTESGLFLADETIKAQEYLRYIGKVEEMGSLCYRHEKFEGAGSWCKVGDFIMHGQHAGQRATVKDNGKLIEYRVINDDDVLCVINDPTKLVTPL